MSFKNYLSQRKIWKKAYKTLNTDSVKKATPWSRNTD